MFMLRLGGFEESVGGAGGVGLPGLAGLACSWERVIYIHHRPPCVVWEGLGYIFWHLLGNFVLLLFCARAYIYIIPHFVCHDVICLIFSVLYILEF